MFRSILFLALVLAAGAPSANAAATGASSACDAALKAHNPTFPNADCKAVGGQCPSTCLASFEALESSCAGQKYTHEKDIDGKTQEVALEWNKDKGYYLLDYQSNKDLFGTDGKCHEVIHDYQLKHINDCDEAYSNVVWDVTFGYYCSEKSTATTCAPECQESINKLESVCNPAGGPVGKYTTTADDHTTTVEKEYDWAIMAAVDILGPDGCTYTSSLTSGAASGGLSVAILVTLLAAPLLLFA